MVVERQNVHTKIGQIYLCDIFVGRQNLTENRMDLKMVSKLPQRILMNLQLLFEATVTNITLEN